MKKSKAKLFAYALIPAIGLGILGFNAASAHGLFSRGFGFGPAATPQEVADAQQNMFEKEAQLLGASVEEVKDAWAEGKSISQLAQEKGITVSQLQQKMKDAKIEELKAQLRTLVDKGIITQVQADKRLQFMQNMMAKTKNGKGYSRGFHGYWGMMGFMR